MNRAADGATAPALPTRPWPFLAHFARRHWRMFLPMVICQLVHSVMVVLGPYALSTIVRGAQAGAAATALDRGVVLFGAFALIEIATARFAGALQLRLAPIQRQAAMRELYAWLQGHSQRYLQANFAGALAHRLSETALAVNQILWALLFDLTPVLITLLLSTALVLRAHAWLGGLLGAWSLLFVGTSLWLARRSRPHALAAAAARAETTGALVDSVTHLSSARIFARMEHERALLDDALRTELAAVRVANRYTERIRWNQAAAFALLKLGTLAYAVHLWRQGSLSLADFVLVITLGIVILSESVSLGRRFLELFEYMGNLDNGVRTLLVPHEVVDAPQPQALRVTAGGIEFRQVGFRYPGGAKVFDGLSVRIAPGQHVGLVGFSGSGKSTFVNLLLRLYDLEEGAILIDGQDIRGCRQDELHGQVALIPQDPGLFHRSLRDNIRYGRLDASDADVHAAARAAHADGFIAHIAQGYEALVGERGVKLSGGQRQRVAIARALLKDAPILVLDEATSSLDSITERAIQEALGERSRGRTVIVIAHRLSTVAHLDRLLVFDSGRLVQDGPHARLVSEPGLYQRLWQMQADGFLGDVQDEGSDAVATLLDAAAPQEAAAFSKPK